MTHDERNYSRNEWTQRVLRLVGEYQSADDLYDHEAEWLEEFSADLARLADEMDAAAVRLEVAARSAALRRPTRGR